MKHEGFGNALADRAELPGGAWLVTSTMRDLRNPAIASYLLSGRSTADIVANIGSYTLGEGGDLQAITTQEAGEGAVAAPGSVAAAQENVEPLALALVFFVSALPSKQQVRIMAEMRDKMKTAWHSCRGILVEA